MAIHKKGLAHWEGDLKHGKGTVSTESGALSQQPYGFNTRFEGVKGTNPEELIGAAHAACFSMALSLMLSEEGYTATSIDTTAVVTLNKTDGGFAITDIALQSQIVLPDVSPAAFDEIIQNTEAGIRKVLNVPDNYKIGFFQGGATQQFAMVPLNFMTTGKADYIVTGNFSNLAAKEAAKFGEAKIVASSKDKNFTYIPDVNAIDYDKDASYIHICQNNTIFGTQYVEVPQVEGVPLVADMSSMILSKPVDVTKYGCIYFGVQKNVAPAGMAIVIVRDDLLGHAADNVPTMMNYTTLLAKNSMYNTPPCWCIYMTGLVLKYLENDIGGLANMQKINEAKAKVLYDYLDGQDFFNNPVEHRYRSTMNVTFTSPDPDLDKKFCAEAADAGFVNLKGHRLVGGMRASIYNAMPVEGVEKLVEFMKKFEEENA